MEGAVVKLIIKAPNQQIKDQIVQCDIGWTIGRLKEYLADVYPSKPERGSQKLIYSGQLLNDSTCLKDVLRQCDGQEDQTYTVHLVCALQKLSANKASSEQVMENTNTIPNTRSTTEHMRLNNTINVQNQHQNMDNVIWQQTPPQLYSTRQYLDPRNSQQMAWMQQAYSNYLTQYVQLVAAQGIQLQIYTPPVRRANTNTNENVGEEQQQPEEQDDEINDGNNGAGGEFVVIDIDWLEAFYMISRVIVLFSIIYFYSSPLRFLLVILFGFAMFLFQGFFRVQPLLLRENNNGRVNRVENNNQVLQNEAAGPQPVPQQQNGQVPTVQADARTNANEEHEEERPGALAFTWTFFSAFFASLIPDQPNVM